MIKTKLSKQLLDHKITFVVFITVWDANPNGDPLNGNRPRTDLDGYGYISPECFFRKLRNFMQEEGYSILYQNPDKENFDGIECLRQRIESNKNLASLMKTDRKKFIEECSRIWLDARLFGATFPFKSSDKDTAVPGFKDHITGAVTISCTKTLSPIDIETTHITKIQPIEPDRRSDTFGARHSVPFAVYKVVGSINPNLARKYGITLDDVQVFKSAILNMFQNDASSARPDGSMEVSCLYWWNHKEANPSASVTKIRNAFNITKVANNKRFEDYKIEWKLDNCVQPEIIRN